MEVIFLIVVKTLFYSEVYLWLLGYALESALRNAYWVGLPSRDHLVSGFELNQSVEWCSAWRPHLKSANLATYWSHILVIIIPMKSSWYRRTTVFSTEHESLTLGIDAMDGRRAGESLPAPERKLVQT